MTPVVSSSPSQGGPAVLPAGRPGQEAHGRPSGGVHHGGQSAPYSLNEILALLGFVGYRGQNQANMAAIAMAESGGDPNATHVNPDGSRDRGLFQINDKAWPGISDACAYDPVCSARQTAAIRKGQGLDAWATWENGSAEGFLPAAEKAQSANRWQQFQSQFANDKLGQANNPNPNQGGSNDASSAGVGTSHTSSGMLFDCSSGHVTTTLGIVPTGVSLPDIGCYMESAFVFAAYAVGGLILVGAGLLLLAHRNPLAMKGGLATAAKTPLMLTPEGRAYLARSKQAAQKPLSPAQQLARDRETRIAARQAQYDPIAASRAKAETSALRAKTAVTREEARAAAQRRKQGAAFFGTKGATVNILGQEVEIPSFETPGVDPTRMVG